MKVKTLFEDFQRLQIALQNIITILNDMKLNYCLIGGYSLSFFNYRRMTEDIDILITKEDFEKLKKEIIGKGYIIRKGSSVNLKDTINNTNIDILITPGRDIQSNPKDISIKKQGVRIVTLQELIKMKIKVGLENVSRLHDLADVQELIKRNKLKKDFLRSWNGINGSVLAKYYELWDSVN